MVLNRKSTRTRSTEPSQKRDRWHEKLRKKLTGVRYTSQSFYRSRFGRILQNDKKIKNFHCLERISISFSHEVTLDFP